MDRPIGLRGVEALKREANKVLIIARAEHHTKSGYDALIDVATRLLDQVYDLDARCRALRAIIQDAYDPARRHSWEQQAAAVLAQAQDD